MTGMLNTGIIKNSNLYVPWLTVTQPLSGILLFTLTMFQVLERYLKNTFFGSAFGRDESD